ncbi:hypothetical protein CYY_007628 [Polysphondylium violaceum]|uniref:Uncharacterized protein n=1 Tax=Polysphondylium violaceum TaxID=133409 RepID=A0A8J4PND9_9MYCE|nr:hypothetical protein CYY_007628 [Polysphondylium violaceum]
MEITFSDSTKQIDSSQCLKELTNILPYGGCPYAEMNDGASYTKQIFQFKNDVVDSMGDGYESFMPFDKIVCDSVIDTVYCRVNMPLEMEPLLKCLYQHQKCWVTMN